jgi:preprotein translocase subunit Sec63
MPPNLNSEDYYEILGCPRNASDADLKKAYRKLAVKVSFHVTPTLIIPRPRCQIFKVYTRFTLKLSTVSGTQTKILEMKLQLKTFKRFLRHSLL